MSLLIKNGTIVTASDIYNGDIYIDEGIIKEIALGISKEADEIIDVKGMYIIPGGVDVHTHFNLDVGIARANDDFYTGTIAAACGGTTTIVDHMGFGPKDCDLKQDLNLDSLLMFEISTSIEEKYKISISEHLHEFHTVQDIVDYILNHIFS